MKKFLILVLVLSISVIAYAELNPSNLSTEDIINRTFKPATTARHYIVYSGRGANHIVAESNTNRKFIQITNISSDGAYIQLQSSADTWVSIGTTNFGGIYLTPTQSNDYRSTWSMEPGMVYTGAIIMRCNSKDVNSYSHNSYLSVVEY